MDNFDIFDGPPAKIARLDIDPNACGDAAAPSTSIQICESIREIKTNILYIIAKSLRDIRRELGIPANFESNINVMDDVHLILFKAHKFLREVATVEGSNSTGKGIEYEVCGTSVFLPVSRYNARGDTIHEIVKKNFSSFGYNYIRGEKWFYTADFIVSSLAGHALRRNEIREGQIHININMLKDEDMVSAIRIIDEFDLDDMYSKLLEGCTYPPKMRKSMLRLVGPVTALILLNKVKPIHQEKWAGAVRRAFKDYPEIERVIDDMKQNKEETLKQLINSIAHIALIIGTRAKNIIFPPPAGICKIILSDTPVPKKGRELVKGPILRNMDFSDVGFFRFYKKFQEQKWKFSANISDEVAKQLVYHSMFGTYTEDYGVLAATTNCASWKGRGGLLNAFEYFRITEKVIEFEPVQQIYFKKQTQARQSEFFTFDQEDNIINCHSDLIRVYNKYRVNLSEKVAKDGDKVNVGKVQWKRVADIPLDTNDYEDYVVEDIVFEDTGRFLMRDSMF